MPQQFLKLRPVFGLHTHRLGITHVGAGQFAARQLDRAIKMLSRAGHAIALAGGAAHLERDQEPMNRALVPGFVQRQRAINHRLHLRQIANGIRNTVKLGEHWALTGGIERTRALGTVSSTSLALSRRARLAVVGVLSLVVASPAAAASGDKSLQALGGNSLVPRAIMHAMAQRAHA